MFRSVLYYFLLFFLAHACIKLRIGEYVHGLLELIFVSFAAYCVARLNTKFAIRRTYEIMKALGAFIIADYEIPGDSPFQVEFVNPMDKVEVPRSRPKPMVLPHAVGEPAFPKAIQYKSSPPEFSYLKDMKLLNELALLSMQSTEFRASPPEPNPIPIYNFSRTLPIGSYIEPFKHIPRSSTWMPSPHTRPFGYGSSIAYRSGLLHPREHPSYSRRAGLTY
ncbi:hypothetical protein FRC11_005064 [Ceratobasidium sp. 423]|nr:hypothetical protein FRC11_005064 [Ceratobasidium sp. 423]